jgi:hypothetical protein
MPLVEPTNSLLKKMLAYGIDGLLLQVTSHGRLLQSQWKMASLSPADWTRRVREGKGVAAVQPWGLCRRGGSAATWVDSNGGNVSLLDVFNL